MPSVSVHTSSTSTSWGRRSGTTSTRRVTGRAASSTRRLLLSTGRITSRSPENFGRRVPMRIPRAIGMRCRSMRRSCSQTGGVPRRVLSSISSSTRMCAFTDTSSSGGRRSPIGSTIGTVPKMRSASWTDSASRGIRSTPIAKSPGQARGSDSRSLGARRGRR